MPGWACEPGSRAGFLICQPHPGVCKELRALGWTGGPVLRSTEQKRASSSLKEPLSPAGGLMVGGFQVTFEEQVSGLGGWESGRGLFLSLAVTRLPQASPRPPVAAPAGTADQMGRCRAAWVIPEGRGRLLGGFVPA